MHSRAEDLPSHPLQSSLFWDQLRNAVDENRRWISASLYSLFIFLLIFLKKATPDYRINRIKRQEDIPQTVYERRKQLIGIVFGVGPQVRECIAVRLDTVDLLLNKPGPESLSVAAAGSIQPREPPPVTGAPSVPNDSSERPPLCIEALRRILLGRRVYFVPVEADVGFIRADVRIRSGLFFKRDLAALLVAQGLAATNKESFSPLRPFKTSSSFHYLQLQINYKRLQRLERAAAARGVGEWRQTTGSSLKDEPFAWRRGPSEVAKRALACMRSLWRATRRM